PPKEPPGVSRTPRWASLPCLGEHGRGEPIPYESRHFVMARRLRGGEAFPARNERKRGLQMAGFATLGSTVVGIALLMGVTNFAAREASRKEMSVSRLVLAHGIDNREPQEPSSTFKTRDDRVYAFVEVQNPTKATGKISVIFEPPSGPALAEIPLEVGD